MIDILQEKYWRFKSVEQFKSLLGKDAQEIINGNRDIQTKDLVGLIEHIGIQNMVFCGEAYDGIAIDHVDTMFVKKGNIDVNILEFISRYGVDESDPCGKYDRFEDSQNYWRFWWD